jgi:hypothetical protein
MIDKENTGGALGPLKKASINAHSFSKGQRKNGSNHDPIIFSRVGAYLTTHFRDLKLIDARK